MVIRKRKYERRRKVFIYGSGFIGVLLAFLLGMGLITDVSHTGDQVCGSVCVSYLNLTVPEYSIHLEKFDTFWTNPKVPVEVFRLDSYNGGRKYCTYRGKYYEFEETKWDGIYYCPQRDFYVPCERLSETKKTCYVAKGEFWMPWKDKTFSRGLNQFKIVGYKNPTETVEWGFKTLTANYGPFWYGTEGADSHFALVTNDNYLIDRFEDYSKVNWDGLVLYLPMDVDEDPITDYTHYGNDGTLGNSTSGDTHEPSFTSSGKYCGAYEFDGEDDYVEITHSSSLSFAGSNTQTIAMWVFPRSISTTQVLMRKPNNWQLYISGSNGRIYYDSFGDAFSSFSSDISLQTNQWYFIVAVADGTNAYIYINGEAEGNSSITGTFTDDGNNLIISYQGYRFNGTIDEVMIWNRALSATEISNLYNYYLTNVSTKWESSNSACPFTQNVTDEHGNPTFAANIISWDNTYRGMSYNGMPENFTLVTKFQFKSGQHFRIVFAGSSKPAQVPCLYVSRVGNVFRLFDSSGGTSDTSVNILPDTWYYAKIVRNKNNVKVYNSTDGHTWTLAIDWTSNFGTGTYLNLISYNSRVLVDDLIIQKHINPATSTTEIGKPANSDNITATWIYSDVDGDAPGEARVTFRKKYANYPKDDYLVSAWEFDRNCNSTFVWDLKGRNNGTVNGALMTSNGKYGTAYRFDGEDDYINVPNSESLNIKKQVTVSAWILIKEINSSLGNAIMNKYQYGALFFKPSGTLYSCIRGNIKGWKCALGGTLTVGTWHLVTQTFDGRYLRSYIDAQEVASYDFGLEDTIQDSSSYAFRIGKHVDTSRANFDGIIDEVLIWNTSLSDDEIWWLYNTQRHYETPVAISYWNFDGGNAKDVGLMRNGNDGTVHGATWTTAGKYGGAYEFDGNGYISIGKDLIGANQSFTVVFWAKRIGDFYDGIVSEDTNGRDWFVASQTGQELYFRIYEADGSLVAYTTNNDCFPPDTWVQGGLIVDCENKKLYAVVNGELTDFTGSWDGSLNNASHDFRIGITFSSWHSFNGTIDEVRIYDRALTAEEIEDLYLNRYKLRDEDTSNVCVESWEAYLEQVDETGEVGTDKSQQIKIDNVDTTAPQFSDYSGWIPPTGGTGKYDTGFTPHATCSDECLQYVNVLVYNETNPALINISEFVYGAQNFTWHTYVNTTDWAFGRYYYKMRCCDAG